MKEGMAAVACTHFEKFTEISQTPRRKAQLFVSTPCILPIRFFYFLTATREMVSESIIHGGGAKWRGVDVDCSDGNRDDRREIFPTIAYIYTHTHIAESMSRRSRGKEERGILGKKFSKKEFES